jgi:hypothetical protein
MFVKHGNRVPTREVAEKANFWAEVMTDGRVGLVAKVREGDFEALLKKTEILVYSQFAALCKALAVLNAPAAIILECEKFVEARESEFHDDVPEAEAIEAVNALRRRLQGEQPPSGGKEEEPEDGKQKKGKKKGKKTGQVSADPVGIDDENPIIDITGKEEVGVDDLIDLAEDDDPPDLNHPRYQVRSSSRRRVPRSKPVPLEVVVPAPKTKKRPTPTTESSSNKKARGGNEKVITSVLKAAGDAVNSDAYLFQQEEKHICLHEPISEDSPGEEQKGCASTRSAGTDTLSVLVFMKIEEGFSELEDHVGGTRIIFEGTMDPSGYLI